MKNLLQIYFIAVFTLLTSVLNAQIFNGNATLSTQNSVDTFSANGYTSVTGNLVIQGGTITNLSNLNTLTNIGGNLILSNCGYSTLSGLNNLQSVGGFLSLWFNNSLTDISALSSLTTISGYFYITNNSSLITLNGLDDLTSIGGDFRINQNSSLSDCCSVGNLINGTNIGGTIVIQSNALGCNTTTQINSGCGITSDFTFTTDNCVGNAIQFTDLSTSGGTITSWNWDFGDGNTSIQQNPIHTYSSAGSYTVSLTVQMGSITDMITSTIDIYNQLEISITEKSSYPNQQMYSVMEGATINHYYLIEDNQGNPVQGVIVLYDINQNGQTITRASVPSDVNGLLNLNIQAGGLDPNTTSDDWIPQGSASILFESVDISNLTSYCDVPLILQNDFSSVILSVGTFTSEASEFGFYYKVGIGAKACAGCLGMGEYGPAALRVGTSGKVGKTLEVTEKRNSGILQGYDIEVSTDVSADIYTSIGVSIKALQLQADLLNASIKLNYKHTKGTYIDINDDKSFLVGLYYLTQIMPDKPSVLTSRAIIEGYLNSQNYNNLITEKGNSFGTEVNASMGLNLTFFTNNLTLKEQFSLDLNNLNYKIGFEIGKNRNYINNQITNYFTGFSNYTFTSLNDYIPISLPSLNLISFPSSRAKEMRLESIKNSLNDNVINGKIIFTNTMQRSVNSSNKNALFNSTVVFDNDVVTYLKSNNLNNPIGNYLIGQGHQAALDLNTNSMIANSNGLISSLTNNFQSSWNEDAIKINSGRVYYENFDLSLSYPIWGANVGVGLSVSALFDVGFYSNLTYPFQTAQYSNDAGIFLQSVSYPDTETFILTPTDKISVFWNHSAQSVNNELSSIQTSIGNWLNTTVGTVQNGLLTFSNNIRNIFYGGRPLAGATMPPSYMNGFNDFCKLTISFPQDSSVFPLNTTGELNHFFPFENSTDIATNGDEFLVVSDIFFFTTYNAADTFVIAPNGDFSIETYIGMEDLEYAGLPTNSTVELFHQFQGDSVWTSIATGNDSIGFNKMGMFVFGVRLQPDTIKPILNIVSPSFVDTTSIISIFISDNETGIDWASVQVTLNSNSLSYERVGFTNEILINLDSFEFKVTGDYILTVQARDNASNLGFDVATYYIATPTTQIEVYESLIKVFPNPTADVLNIIYDLNKTGDVLFEVVDINGRVIVSESEGRFEQNTLYQKQIKVNDYANGIYILRLFIDSELIENRKFVIQH
jgi:PKD repeat protein